MSLRSSALPKLAQCSSFEGSRGPAGPAALRGITIDYVWRKQIWIEQGNHVDDFDEWSNNEDPVELGPADDKSIEWGVEAVRSILGEHFNKCETRASQCKIRAPFMNSTGEMDGVCHRTRTTFDLKTGMIRGYREQMAAYALGMMEETFEEEWTCYLIFCDQREAVRHDFTRAEAEEIIKNLAAEYHTEEKQPTPCEYCNWCAHANTCDARIISANKTFGQVGRLVTGDSFDEILDDEEELASFLDGAHVVMDYQNQAKDRAREVGGVNGWKTVKFKGREFVDKKALPEFVKQNELDLMEVLSYCSALPANKLREIAGDKADKIISRGKDVLQLRKTKKDTDK